MAGLAMRSDAPGFDRWAIDRPPREKSDAALDIAVAALVDVRNELCARTMPLPAIRARQIAADAHVALVKIETLRGREKP